MKFVNGCLQVALCVYVLDSEGLVIISFFFFLIFYLALRKIAAMPFPPLAATAHHHQLFFSLFHLAISLTQQH